MLEIRPFVAALHQIKLGQNPIHLLRWQVNKSPVQCLTSFVHFEKITNVIRTKFEIFSRQGMLFGCCPKFPRLESVISNY